MIYIIYIVQKTVKYVILSILDVIFILEIMKFNWYAIAYQLIPSARVAEFHLFLLVRGSQSSIYFC